jgi:membrane protein implicated in regulation of membrane protease activity
VKVFGSVWTAYPAEGERPLSEGEKVEVVSVEGSSIYVKKLVSPEETKGDWH